MSRATIIIRTESDRSTAAKWSCMAPVGTSITFKRNKRSIDQNSRMWALLSIVAANLLWHGQKYSPMEWKDYFMHAYRGEKWMPSEDGGMVPIGRSTSELSKEEHSELTAVIEAFCARQGLDVSERVAA